MTIILNIRYVLGENPMITISKKFIVDEQRRPKEVIIPWEQYQLIREMLGLDLDENAVDDSRQAQRDRVAKNQEAYVDLDSIQ